MTQMMKRGVSAAGTMTRSITAIVLRLNAAIALAALGAFGAFGQAAYAYELLGFSTPRGPFRQAWTVLRTVWMDAGPVLVMVGGMSLVFALNKLKSGHGEGQTKAAGSLGFILAVGLLLPGAA